MSAPAPTCPDCHGAGFLYGDNGPAPREWICEECGGAGVVEASGPACDYCTGPLNEGVCPECDLPLVVPVNLPARMDRIAAERKAA